ncbi:unnamed protein product [Bemisia tabaci]|uniref:DNA mismatch repair protein MSH2 n=1 Tax=Bemisia tabaci TaxID=7038 RepID=A0A9P0ADC5_BEMTA|nr:unnamed protein product [Bemisia tabaci]
MVEPATKLNLDPKQQQRFIAFFKSLPQKPATTIRFFNRTDFYTLHGSDAVFAAKEVYKTTSFLKMIGSENDKLESIILNKNNFESFLRDLLLVKSYRVEVYCNKPTAKGSASWVLEFKGSPGNLSQFEDLLFDSVDQVEWNCVAAIKIGTKNKDKVVGVAMVDAVDHKFNVCEFVDDEYFTNLGAFITQHGPKECLVPDGCCENAKKVVSRGGILVSSRKNAEFSDDGLVQELNKLLLFQDGQLEKAAALPEMNLKIAAGALHAIIKYLELLSNQENYSQYSISTFELSKFVHLDASAVQALNITPQSQSTIFNKHHSIIGLLDKCRTSHGHRLLAQWIKQPLCDINAIQERHDIVEALAMDITLRASLHDDHLRRIPDLQALSKKVHRKKANLQDCYRIYQAVSKLPDLLNSLETSYQDNPQPTLSSCFITPLKEQITELDKYQEMVQSTIDLDSVDKGEYLIKSEFDQDLQDYREKMEKLEEQMKKHLTSVASDLDYQAHKQIKLESNSMHGFFFRVTLKDAKAITRNKSYEVLDTNKGGARFRTKKLDSLNEEYLQIRENYTKHQESIVNEVVSIAAGYTNTLQFLSFTLAQLDVLCSFAMVAESAPKPFVRPKMHPKGTGILSLKQCRHPCLELEDGISYVPNDVHFEQGKSTFIIITGPNMGGKSTYIRSIGVTALLAHIGCFVPCDSAEISILDAILARMGAHDSQLKGMSTFMVEMVETSSILRKATADSLVIIDELGRGTSTYEGCGIAWAIVEHLAKEIKCPSLFATHFHELTRLADEIETIHNFHVTALTLEDKLLLLYQVKPGVCNRSFGIHIAKMAKFPDRVVEESEQELQELEDFQAAAASLPENDRKRHIQEGEQLIEDFYSKVMRLKTSESSEEDIEKKFEELKQDLLSKKNPYIEALIK